MHIRVSDKGDKRRHYLRKAIDHKVIQFKDQIQIALYQDHDAMYIFICAENHIRFYNYMKQISYKFYFSLDIT